MGPLPPDQIEVFLNSPRFVGLKVRRVCEITLDVDATFLSVLVS